MSVKILGIESSCDETAASVSLDGRTILSNIVASQVEEHKKFGGVVPEIASRRHCENILDTVRMALDEAHCTLDDLDGIAVTYAPGLIGALLVGTSFAKGLAMALDKPLIPRSSYCRAYCHKLHRPPRVGAAISLPCGKRRSFPYSRGAELYQVQGNRQDKRRCGRRGV